MQEAAATLDWKGTAAMTVSPVIRALVSQQLGVTAAAAAAVVPEVQPVLAARKARRQPAGWAKM